MKVNNDAMVWQYMKIGFYSKPAFTTGDYFEAIFTGYDAAGNETGKVTVPLGISVTENHFLSRIGRTWTYLLSAW